MPRRDPPEDNLSASEQKRRLEATLRGAFAGSPTPLKDIPTREGESRRLERKKRPKAASSASAKTASRGKKSRAQ